MATGLEVGLAGLDLDVAGVDHRLEDLIAPLQKKVALLSSGEPANSSTFHGLGLPAGLEALDERLGLQLADLQVVEGGVVVDGVGVAQQPVVGDDGDAVGLGVGEGTLEGGAVDRGDDQDVVLPW